MPKPPQPAPPPAQPLPPRPKSNKDAFADLRERELDQQRSEARRAIPFTK